MARSEQLRDVAAERCADDACAFDAERIEEPRQTVCELSTICLCRIGYRHQTQAIGKRELFKKSFSRALRTGQQHQAGAAAGLHPRPLDTAQNAGPNGVQLAKLSKSHVFRAMGGGVVVDCRERPGPKLSHYMYSYHLILR